MKKIAPIHWLFLLSHSVQNAWIEIVNADGTQAYATSHSMQNARIEML